MTALSPLRVGRITGSRVAGVLGISPYQTRAGVMREMVRQHHGAPDEFSGNEATEWGNEHEPDALLGYQRTTGLLVTDRQEFVLHPEHPDDYAVSLDGRASSLGGGERGIVEAKCPMWGRYIHHEQVPHYQAQMFLQMECTGADWCDFVVWRTTGLAISRLERDPYWFEVHKGAFDAFLAEYRETIADPVLSAPHLDSLMDVRTDPEWLEAAAEWLDRRADAEQAQHALADAQARLVELAGGKKCVGGGAQVVVSKPRKGSIDWPAFRAANAPDVDAEQWRKPSATEPTYSVRLYSPGQS